MRTPPTALTKTSWSSAAMPAWRCSTASIIARRSRSRPTESRRGLGPPASTSACTSTSIGRVPFERDQHARPRHRLAVRRQEDRARVADALQALLGHREDADLVDRAEAVLDRAHEAKARVRVALEIEHGVDDVLQHARPGERAVLGDVADEHDRRPARLGGARQLRRALAHLRDRAGRRRERLAVDGLDRIDHRDRGLLARERRQDLLETGSRQAPAPRSRRDRAGASAAPPARRSPRR